MNVTIHQPEHMPWLGFFHKINSADIYVVLDSVQYARRYFQNRNKIRTREGWKWLTIPLQKDSRDDLLIKDAKIFCEDSKWKDKNIAGIYHNYCKSLYFSDYWEEFKIIYSKEYTYLADFNITLLRFFFQKIGIDTEIKLSSSLGVEGVKSDIILNTCISVGAKKYISGISGKDYLDMQKFKDHGIEISIQEFHHPLYKQLYDPFIPCMSIVDLLFNHGKKSLDIINGVDVPVMEELFT